MSKCLEVKEVYMSKLLELNLLENGIVLVKGKSSIVIQRQDDLKALKRFVDKLLEGKM